MYLGCVDSTLAEKCIVARLSSGTDSEGVALAVKELGGKFSDLVELTDQVLCGNTLKGNKAALD